MGDEDAIKPRKNNVETLKQELKIGDRAKLKPGMVEKYVAKVQLGQKDSEKLQEWRERRQEAIDRGEEDKFLDSVHHPKGEFITSSYFEIADNPPGQYKLIIGNVSETFVLVDRSDVEKAN